MTHRLRFAFLLVLSVSGTAAAGQDVAGARTYGTAFDSVVSLSSWAFEAEDSLIGFASQLPDQRYTRLPGCFDAPLNLPGGALIDFFEMLSCDTSSGVDDEVNAGILACDSSGSNCQVLGNEVVRTTDAPGCVVLASKVLGQAVDNVANLYWVRACTGSGNSTTTFRGVRVWYRLQVSPAPAVATFGDVPTNYIYFRAVEALAKSGVTSGCGGGNFCPDQAVTRGEMAKFLANALGLAFK
jgi:hypothetical protein